MFPFLQLLQNIQQLEKQTYIANKRYKTNCMKESSIDEETYIPGEKTMEASFLQLESE